MGKFVHSVLWFVLLGGAVGQVSTNQCGYDRWPVKIMADKDRERVDLHPVDTTVARLTAVAIHEIPYPYDHRIAPEELLVFRLNARLLSVKRERDSDLHLLLQDLIEPDKKMVAEIPAPACSEGTGFEQGYESSRRNASEIRSNSIVEVVGVGFFDFLHTQQPGAKNGFELHPVLSIRKVE